MKTVPEHPFEIISDDQGKPHISLYVNHPGYTIARDEARRCGCWSKNLELLCSGTTGVTLPHYHLAGCELGRAITRYRSMIASAPPTPTVPDIDTEDKEGVRSVGFPDNGTGNILVRLKAETREKVKEAAEAENLTVAEWMRRAVRSRLARWAPAGEPLDGRTGPVELRVTFEHDDPENTKRIIDSIETLVQALGGSGIKVDHIGGEITIDLSQGNVHIERGPLYQEAYSKMLEEIKARYPAAYPGIPPNVSHHQLGPMSPSIVKGLRQIARTAAGENNEDYKAAAAAYVKEFKSTASLEGTVGGPFVAPPTSTPRDLDRLRVGDFWVDGAGTRRVKTADGTWCQVRRHDQVAHAFDIRNLSVMDHWLNLDDGRRYAFVAGRWVHVDQATGDHWTIHDDGARAVVQKNSTFDCDYVIKR